MDLDIKGLRVLVTAGGNGIGLAIARRFAAEGARVHICDVDETALSALAASDPEISQTPCDVSDRAAVKDLFADAIVKLGGLDVLVNNAGIAGPTSKVEEMNPEDWDRCLEICLTGQFNCTRLAVPLLRNSKNASIVNISSAAGKDGVDGGAHYSSSKFAVIGFTQSLAKEVAQYGIRVNAVCPGVVPTQMIADVGAAWDMSTEQMVSTWQLIKRPQDAREIGAAVVFLTVMTSMTGQAINVDGGSVFH